eukprot:366009-Chlamydomonas_euryale.AAC.27
MGAPKRRWCADGAPREGTRGGRRVRARAAGAPKPVRGDTAARPSSPHTARWTALPFFIDCSNDSCGTRAVAVVRVPLPIWLSRVLARAHARACTCTCLEERSVRCDLASHG